MKTKVTKLFKKRTIKEQILISMLLSSMLAAIALGIILFSFSKRTIEKNYQSAHEHNLQVSSSIIDIYFKSFVDLSRTLLNHNGFKQALLGEENTGAYFSSLNSRAIEHILIDLGEQSQYIRNITVVSGAGHIIFQSKLNYQSGKMQQYYREKDILQENWVFAAQEACGKEIFYGYNILFDDNGETFSMVKELRNPDNQDVMGYVVFNIKKQLFEKAFGKSEEGYSTNRYMIIDKRAAGRNDDEMGELLYFNGDESAKEAILNSYLDGRQDLYLFSRCHNEGSGWEIVNVIEKSELSRDSNYIGWITVFVCLVMLILCVFVASTLSRVITRPLMLLGKMIQRVGDGKYRVDVEFDETEIGRIGNQFKSMVNNNLDLHDKLLQSVIREKEAELLLLQSQINPHFLYNTLDSLYFMAMIKEADEIADMVLALSDTFKLSLNKGDKLIDVHSEIQKIKAYIKIQNMRYHDRFVVDIQIDETIMEEKMLTFILQPLVENAVYHGLEPKVDDECRIFLGGFREGETLVFIIRDNGVGIEDLTVLEKGYGVRNIRERISLFYGDAGAILFSSTPGKGTEVRIRIPVLDEEGQRGSFYVSYGDCR